MARNVGTKTIQLLGHLFHFSIFFLLPMTVNQLGVRSGVCLTITSDALLDLSLRRRESLSFQVCAPVGLDVTKLQIC